MKGVRNLIGYWGMLSLASCAIHPLPDDTTGLSTNDIVENVRCEARDAIRDEIVDILRSHGTRGDFAAAEYAETLRGDSTGWATFNTRRVHARAVKALDKVVGSAIAYNFSLDMTEVNNIDPGLGLINPLTGGAFTMPFTGGFDRTRDNKRTFTISDPWIKLITTPQENINRWCPHFVRANNYVYPITGKIGVDEMIHTFVGLSYKDLTADGSSSNSTTETAKAATMSDQLTFTTKISGGATPSVTFAKIPQGLSVQNGSLGLTASRQDAHEVTIGLSLPVTKAPAGTAASSLLVTASSTATPTEQSAVNAIAQSIYRYNRFGLPIFLQP